MESRGRCRLPRRIQILPESKDRMKPSIMKWKAEGKRVRFSFAGEGTILGTEEGGWIVIDSDAADIHIETWYRRGTLTQLATLKALEALLYWSDYDQYPPSSELLWGYHEFLMNTANIMRKNEVTGQMVRITTSCPDCTSIDMNKFIDIAIDELLTRDIPESMVDLASQKSFKDLYREWYRVRSTETDLESIKNWDEYRRVFPYCEFTCIRVPEAGTGLTQQIHIVSRGSSPQNIDEPWNWIHGLTTIHQKIHKFGWDVVLQEFPHMIPKVKKARELAKKKALK